MPYGTPNAITIVVCVEIEIHNLFCCLVVHSDLRWTRAILLLYTHVYDRAESIRLQIFFPDFKELCEK